MDKNKLIQLRDKLKQLKQHKQDNQIDYMDWEAYPKQDDMRKNLLDRLLFKVGNKKIYVAFGGNRSGKTELGAGVVSTFFEKKPNAQIMCATVDYKTSISVQQTKINKLLRKKKIEYGMFNPARGYANEVVIGKNRSKLIFRTYQQGREAVQGMDLDFIWGDEEMPWDYFQECLARLTDRDGIFLLTFTSLSGFTRLVNFLWESNNKLIESTVLSIMDNPFISQQAKDNYMLTVDQDEIESRVYGKPHLKEGLIYKEFGEINKVEPFEYMELVRNNPLRYELHEGIDPHERTPHHWLQFLFDRKQNAIYIVNELKAPYESMLVADFARLIKAQRGVSKSRFGEKIVSKPLFCQIDTSSMKPNVIYKHPDEDQENAHTVRLEFHKCGIETILCSKDNAVGIGEVKHRLKVVKTKDGTIKKKPTLYVFKTCTGVIWEFSRYSWDSYSNDKMTEKNELLNRPMKKNDHFMDVIKYECLKMKLDTNKPLPAENYEEIYEGMGY